MSKRKTTRTLTRYAAARELGVRWDTVVTWVKNGLLTTTGKAGDALVVCDEPYYALASVKDARAEINQAMKQAKQLRKEQG